MRHFVPFTDCSLALRPPTLGRPVVRDEGRDSAKRLDVQIEHPVHLLLRKPTYNASNASCWLRPGRNPYEKPRKSSSQIWLRTVPMACWAILSSSAAIPNGRACRRSSGYRLATAVSPDSPRDACARAGRLAALPGLPLHILPTSSRPLPGPPSSSGCSNCPGAGDAYVVQQGCEP